MSNPSAATGYDVVILGGGAAGLMCAAVAGARGRSVLVIERANRVGKKILMSGGGRCNFTNLDVRPEHFLSANPHFCKSALARYRPADFIALVDAYGIQWHEKERGQLFCDESAKQIVAMLLAECQNAGVTIRTQCEVETATATDAGFRLATSAGPVTTGQLVVATGGLSIPRMGATGFGYDLAQQFGHAIRPTRAALVPLTLSGRPLEDWQPLSGVSLPIRAHAGRQSFDGAMLLTHRGLSGPVILQISSYWAPGDRLQLDLLPDGDAEDWLAQARETRPQTTLLNLLAERFPRRFAQQLCAVLFDDGPLQHFKAQRLRGIARQLHDWPVPPSGTEGYRTAEVTLGGVDTRGVDSTTMASKQQPGLYFIGEVLDVTGHLGGYNFQWAWASAVAAGNSL
ncbi:BaiN/RdsA family NAD(P)/FAD-dependent oxidoreductase [Algiphilus aromaticivorans]|uniref:NAD(P)/FAD-dependent oxidoreductase n=1 Tax=Algiphilus aromaticivorans TaxID=382454 RepID=UPI0005C1D95B|nr:NAD(P)/FAD-dependent oxidoreductase [Algiphilus aromaticivorans]